MMRNVQEFIDSGIIDEYCLGILPPDKMAEVAQMSQEYPEIEAEIERTIQALMAYEADERALAPELKYRILDTLNQLADAPVFDLHQLPLLSADSNSDQWQRTLASIQPMGDYRNVYTHPLREDAQVTQFLIWVKHEVRPETHHDERESFLILEGECICTVGEQTVRLMAGDFVEIPLAVDHSVRILSDTPVKAVVQRVKWSA